MKTALIATPSARGNIRVEAMTNIISNIALLRTMDIDAQFMCVTYAEVSVARNKLAAEFLASDAEWLLMQDDDVSIEPSIVKRIFELENDFTGVFLPPRQMDLNKFGDFIRAGCSNDQARINTSPHIGLGNKGAYNSITEVEAIGGGFLVIHRRVFENMISHGDVLPYEYRTGSTSMKIYGFFNNISDGGSFIGEDYSFCVRHKNAGGKIFAYYGPGITHVGTFGFRS